MAVLEEENQLLRSETLRIAEDVEKTEAEEKYLVDDAIKRLGKAISQECVNAFVCKQFIANYSCMFLQLNPALD